MTDETVAKGQKIYADLKSSNQRDYLTSKVLTELESVVNSLDGLEGKINSIASEVEAERQRLAEIERQRQAELERQEELQRQRELERQRAKNRQNN